MWSLGVVEIKILRNGFAVGIECLWDSLKAFLLNCSVEPFEVTVFGGAA